MTNMYLKNKMTSQELQLLASEMDAKKKSTAVTYLLWFFFGGLGGHRYYLGKYGTAILMTLTIGCLGFWTLIDLFLINGMLKKKNSEIESEIISKIQLLNQEPKERVVTTTPIKNTETETNINTKLDTEKITNTESSATITHSQQIQNSEKEIRETSPVEPKIEEIILEEEKEKVLSNVTSNVKTKVTNNREIDTDASTDIDMKVDAKTDVDTNKNISTDKNTEINRNNDTNTNKDIDTNTNANTNTSVDTNAKPKTNLFSFRTAGISLENDKGKDIQSTLQRYARKYCKENDIDLFGGYTNKEILEDYFLSEGVSEFCDLSFDNKQVIFVPEPDNPYDKNAIKIYLDFDFDQLHIGYVPKKYTKKLMNIINTKEVVSFDGKIIGGNIKEMVMDDYTDKWKVEKKQLTLGFEIDIIYKEE